MVAQWASRRRLAWLSCILGMHVGIILQASAQEASEGERDFILGTASAGGTYHPVGVALSTLIKLKLLPESDIDLTAVNTEGSTENIELLRNDQVQFAIVSSLAGHDARTGTGQFAGVEPADDLRAVASLWLSTNHLLVRADAVESGTIDDFIALEGRPVSLGRERSGTLLENRVLMASLGVDVDKDFQLTELGYGESADALIDGRIDGMSVSSGVPNAAVQRALDALGEKAMVLEVSDEQLALIDKGRGVWQRAVIPSGAYPGQARDIFAIGTPNILVVRADVDDEVVYQITRTLFEELDFLHGLHGATSQIGLDDAVGNLPLPVHEGASRYYREKGIELSPPPVALDPNLLTRYDSTGDAQAAVNEGVVTLFAGVEGDTSTRIASELASVLDAGDDGIRLIANNGGGMGRNLTDLLYLKGVDAALVRADLLHYADEQNVFSDLSDQISVISEMFPEEVHLLVRDDIASPADLTGRVINIGEPGGGADVTASVILSELNLRAERTRFGSRQAIDKLQRGEIDGAFFVGGKPMPLLRQIPSESGLKLLALPEIRYADSYQAAEIQPADYPDLIAGEGPLSTIAVRTALLTYRWSPDSPRHAPLATLTDALFRHLPTLQADGHHPKWLEVDPAAEFETWPRFQPAVTWLDNNEGTARRIAYEGRRRLKRRIEASALATADEPPAQPARPGAASAYPASQPWDTIKRSIEARSSQPAAEEPDRDAEAPNPRAKPSGPAVSIVERRSEIGPATRATEIAPTNAISGPTF